MSGDPSGLGVRAKMGSLPELDLDADEAASLKPTLDLHARNGGIAQAPVAPPPPAARKRVHVVAQEPDIQLDTAPAETGGPLRYRPAVYGVGWGPMPAQTAGAASEERARSLKMANYGDVPREPWRYGLYAFRVLTRKRELVKARADVAASAAQAHAAYEKAILAVAERVRQTNAAARANASVREMRTSAAAAANRMNDAGDGVDPQKRTLVESAFRALDDTKSFGAEWNEARREIDRLQETVEQRTRVVRQHDLALAAADRRVVTAGVVSYVGGGVLLLLVIFSPVIARTISPPELPPLPPDTAAGKHAE